MDSLIHFSELIGYVILIFAGVAWTIIPVCLLIYLGLEGGNIWKSFERWLDDKD